MEIVIKKCRWCGRKMKAITETQAEYNLNIHEDSCLFSEKKVKK